MNRRDGIRESILNEPLFPLLVKTALPSVVGMLVSVVYNLTDIFFIGLLNDRAMTASVGLSFGFISIVQALGFWFGYGSGNRMSRKLGECEGREACKLSALGLVLALCTGLILTVLSFLFLDGLVTILGGAASPKLFSYTKEYMGPIILSILFSLYSITAYNQLRLCGYVNDAMFGLLAGIITNIVMDPSVIFGFNMGFVGAAYASLVGQILAAFILTWLGLKNSSLYIFFHPSFFTKGRIYHILVGGVPNFARQGISTLSLVLLNLMASDYGDSVIAAMTLSTRVLAFVYMLMIGWGQGFQPICAINYGAKRYDRVRSLFRLTVKSGTTFLIISGSLMALFADFFLGLLTKDAELVELSVLILRLQCVSLPLLCFFALSGMLMQNVGQYGSALAITISRQGYIYIPLLFLLTRQFGRLGLFLVQPASDILSFLIGLYCVCRFFAGKEFS